MTTVKASLRNRGSGKLEFAEGTLRFYVERGRFKKTSDLVREIPVADIESVALAGNELSVTWMGVADVFDLETTESAKTLCDEMNALLAKPKVSVESVGSEKPVEVEAAEDKEAIREEEEKAPQQEAIALGKVVGVALDVADSLFDILKGLQGHVDWKLVEGSLERSKEGAGGLAGMVVLDFAGLSSAVKLRRAGEVSKEAYGVLKSLFEYFAGLSVAQERLQNVHPSCDEARKTVLAYYMLNDIVLGVVVGDAEVEKEGSELRVVLEGLSKETGVKVDLDAVKAVVNHLVAEKAAESAVEESRSLFRKQQEEFVAV